MTAATAILDTTIPEKILLAAFDLDEAGQSPFSAEALIVRSWEKFPRTFGLKGYADQYPSDNKVMTSIMGEKGLAKRGFLAKMGAKLYTLTREGRQSARRLLGPPETNGHANGKSHAAAPPAKLSREQEKLLLNLLTLAAVEKHQQGLKLELTFADACAFWGVTEKLRGEALDARLNRLRAELAEVDRIIPAGGVDLANGRSVSQDDLRLLHKVDDYLADRFGRHLTLLRNRG